MSAHLSPDNSLFSRSRRSDVRICTINSAYCAGAVPYGPVGYVWVDYKFRTQRLTYPSQPEIALPTHQLYLVTSTEELPVTKFSCEEQIASAEAARTEVHN